MSLAVTIAKTLAAAIPHAGLSLTPDSVTAIHIPRPQLAELETGDGPTVYVTPGGRQMQWNSRSSAKWIVTVDVHVLARVAAASDVVDESRLEALQTYVEELGWWLMQYEPRVGESAGSCTGVTNAPPYVLEHLTTLQQFTSTLSAQFTLT